MSETDIPCREVVELLTGYLEDGLPPARRAAVDAHLAGCEGCTNALTQFRATIEVAGRLAEDPAEDQMAGPEREALRAVFRAWRAEPEP